jgi:lysophospholipid acyltransferase (LPLAT)-like uncharacterized protein
VQTSAPVVPQTASDIAPQARFTRRQRLLIWLIGWAEYLLIRVLGPTLRYSLSIEEGGPSHRPAGPVIYAFWHRCLIPSCFLARAQQIAVLISTSFDAECSLRALSRFGYRSVRGSSTRGGMGALLGLQKEIETGHAVAFTIDGPKGPRYVAKPGPVLLARLTGLPIICFHIALQDPWVLAKSWDQCMIPKPFSRALVRVSKLVHVPPDAQSLDPYRDEMQAALDRAREFAEVNVDRAESVGQPTNTI